MDRTREYTTSNRTSWNTIAPARPPQTPEFFAQGGSTLDGFEPDLLPEISGKKMLHLACSNGNDSISWAQRGASVTGVDISDVAVEAASTLAYQTGADARFVAADIYELPEDLRDFDVVYSSWGVVCWIPDLDRWARIVARCLRVGGTFVLCEHHPIWEVLGVRGDHVKVTVDYFGRSQPTTQSYDQAKMPTGSTPETSFTTFVWPVSDVVMSLLRAGLVIEEFFEAPEPEMYEGLTEGASRVPAIYAIKATKP